MAKVRVIFSIALIMLLLALIGCDGGTNALHPNTGGLTGGNAAPKGNTAESGLFPVRMNPQAVAQTGGWPAQHQASAIAAQARLARPSELAQLLPQAKRAAYLDADLIKAGADFDVVLPANRVSTVVAPSVIFSPIWGSQAQPQLSDAAYCIYRFSLAGFDASGQPQTLALAWYPGSEPADYADLWVGLASRASDRWEWYSGPADGVLTLASFTPYIAGNGDTLIAVVMLGSSDCALQSLKVGEPELRATGGMPGGLGEDTAPPPAGGGSLPASVDLSPWCSPIDDQGQIGSCTCFATARGAFDYELGQVYAADGWDFGNPLNLTSTKYLYWQSDCADPPWGYEGPIGCGGGRYTSFVVAYLSSDWPWPPSPPGGVSSELNCPYLNVCSQDWGQAAIDDAALLGTEGSTSIDPTGNSGVAKLKDVLANQRKVVIFQTAIDYDFSYLGPDDVWEYTGQILRGNHAMCLVGYDDAKQAFKVRNSWGTDWAGGGYGWIGYQTFLDGDSDLWLWAWTLDVEYNAAVAQRFCGQQQELAPPTNVRATDGFYADRIQVQWYKSTGATGYEVYRDQQTNLVATLGDVAIWSDYGISDYLGHTYWVKATAPGLESALSSPDTGYLAQSPVVQNVTPQSGAPGEVVTFNAQVSGSTPMTYAWDFGGGASPNTSSNISPQVTLSSSGSYSASLSVTNDYGSDVYTFDLAVQSAPLNLIAIRVGDHIQLDWEPPALGLPDGYNAYVGTNALLSDALMLNPSLILGLTYNVNTLFPPENLYYFGVKASTGGIEGAYSNIYQYDPGNGDLTDPEWQGPAGIQSAEAGDSEVTVTWSSAVDINTPPVEYLLYCIPDGQEFDWNSPNTVFDSTYTSTTITGLTNGQTYMIAVRAQDSVAPWPNITDNMNFCYATPGQAPPEDLLTLPKIYGRNFSMPAFIQIFMNEPKVRRDGRFALDGIGGSVSAIDPVAYSDVLKDPSSSQEFPVSMWFNGSAYVPYPVIVIEETNSPSNITGPDDPDAVADISIPFVGGRDSGRINVDITSLMLNLPPPQAGVTHYFCYKLYNQNDGEIGWGHFDVPSEPVDLVSPVGVAWGINVGSRGDWYKTDFNSLATDKSIDGFTMTTPTPDVFWVRFNGGTRMLSWDEYWSEATNDNVQVVFEDITNPDQMSRGLFTVAIGVTASNDYLAIHHLNRQDPVELDYMDWVAPIDNGGVFNPGDVYNVILDDPTTGGLDYIFPDQLIVSGSNPNF